VNLLADSPVEAFSVAEEPAPTFLPTARSNHGRIAIAWLALALLVGIFCRLPQSAFYGERNPLRPFAILHPQSKYTQIGFVGMDEDLYRRFVLDLSFNGLSSYPLIVEHYIEVQKRAPKALLPPSRFLFIYSTYVWHSWSGTNPLSALAEVASIFSILTLLLSGAFAWRLGGRFAAIAVTALTSCAPTQIHMSQHGMIDGFFTFWALLSLWTLWENLRAPGDWRWTAAYTVALALLVLTKENAFFVWVALVAIILSNRWLKFGVVTRELLLATVIGPLLGVVTLLCLAGGWGNLIEMYQLLVSKASASTYAIQTGDGPWFRYILDLVIVSPLVTLLAVGTIFRLNRTMKTELFLTVFIAASYLIMCNVKYGMNLRYANIWDMPLRFLAVSQIVALTRYARRYAVALSALCVVLIAALELRQFYILTINYPLYELVTHHLLRALQILK
jgi:hypothetical protein